MLKLGVTPTSFVTSEDFTRSPLQGSELDDLRDRYFRRDVVDFKYEDLKDSESKRYLEALYKANPGNTDANNTSPWVRYQMILDAAIERLGANPEMWFELQLRRNTRASNATLEFVVDTLDYILNGVRRFSAENWLVLLQARAGIVNTEKRNDVIRRGLELIEQAAETIHCPGSLYERWLSRDKGIEDLLCTLYIIYVGEYDLNASLESLASLELYDDDDEELTPSQRRRRERAKMSGPIKEPLMSENPISEVIKDVASALNPFGSR